MVGGSGGGWRKRKPGWRETAGCVSREEKVMEEEMMMTRVEANVCEKPSQTWSGNCGNTGHCDKQCKDWEHASHGACHKRDNHWKCFCYFECKKQENHEQKKV
ncbi:hypothetical protein Q3G72_027028 [Acer saccharum]|nr:hypothetical protein Q3G72_027028 [Acer saccharum]